MHRIKLEAAQYADNAFLTLTYADEHLPPLQSLDPYHLKMFLDRVRTKVRRSQIMQQDGEPRLIRYFAVGEYGDISERPHYHVVLFNYPPCVRGQTRKPPKYSSCCPACDLIAESWVEAGRHGKSLGIIQNDRMSDALACYVGGYVTKKLNKGHPDLKGRYPEFARQSNRPGIGAYAMHDVADVLMRYYDIAAELGDVPNALDHGRSRLPLGRYLRGYLRRTVGLEKNAPQVTLDAQAAEMLSVRLAARNSEENPSIKGQVIERDKGKIARVVARHKLRKQWRSL